MIYCFSGTGNSLSVAHWLANRLNEQIVQLPTTPAKAVTISQEQRIILIFPTYAWGVPKVVKDFIHSLPRIENKPPTFAIFTCGDDIGMADKILEHQLDERDWELNDAFSVTMRETYICLPGFDIDTPTIEKRKFQQAEQRTNAIADSIQTFHADSLSSQGQISKAFLGKKLTRGSFAWFKSYVIRPLFNRFLMSDKHFHSTSACIHCGKCVKTCPLDNISMKDDLPQWNRHCTHCLRCYHACPTHAIEYGFFTKGKGQVKINF